MTKLAFIQEFFRRKGQWMMAANVLNKIMGFTAVVYVTRNTTEAEFGAYSYALNIVLALVPFMGLGAYQAFLRYSSDSLSQTQKKDLYHYSYSRGILFSMILVASLILLAPWLCRSLPESIVPFRILAFVVLTTLNMEFVKSYARAIHRNAISAKIDITYATFLLILSVALTSIYGILGYAVAVASAPVIAVLYNASRMNILSFKNVSLSPHFRGFWKYGIFTTIGALLAKFFFAVDVFMIGHFVGEKASSIAIYRVAVIIPMATLVLPVSIAATDYVKNSANKLNPTALKSYIKNYWLTFGWLSLAALGILYLIAPWLLNVFGSNYAQGAQVMRIFLIGIFGAHLLRIPFGNLLSAVGKADWNTYINLVVLILTASLCYIFIPQHGILGAAYTMASMLWLSGIFNGLTFVYYLNSIKKY